MNDGPLPALPPDAVALEIGRLRLANLTLAHALQVTGNGHQGAPGGPAGAVQASGPPATAEAVQSPPMMRPTPAWEASRGDCT